MVAPAIGLGISLGSSLLGAGISALGARRRRANTEAFLEKQRAANRADALALSQSVQGLTPGARGRLATEGGVRANRAVTEGAFALQQADVASERTRGAALFGGLGGALASGGAQLATGLQQEEPQAEAAAAAPQALLGGAPSLEAPESVQGPALGVGTPGQDRVAALGAPPSVAPVIAGQGGASSDLQRMLEELRRRSFG